MTSCHPASVPFFRPSLTDDEIEEVVACLRSGWLTTGPRTKQFESDFTSAVGAKYAVAVTSCTAALHLAVEALGLRPGQGVLVPTMTFAATAEVVRYQGAIPILVDCDPVTLNMNVSTAEQALADLRSGVSPLDPGLEVVGIMPVHVGGLMLDMDAVRDFATANGLWIVEDGAHALPAAYRTNPDAAWRRCGEATADVTCYSFYANKTITTGEGGMAVTNDESLAARMRSMSLHGLSQDAWKRFSGGPWDYRIVSPGYKYNLTDIASSIGIHQLRRAESLRQRRETLARRYLAGFADLSACELPPLGPDRIHSWHLFPIRLRPEALAIDRNEFIEVLKARGIGTSVHWRPLHLHPYYEKTFGWRPTHLPVASQVWPRLLSLPLSPTLADVDVDYVVDTVRDICTAFAFADGGMRRAA